MGATHTKTGNFKEYYCCICKKKLDYKPIRLVKQIHDNKEDYGKYHNVCNYNFCNGCYKVFNNWIVKHKESKEWEIRKKYEK